MRIKKTCITQEQLERKVIEYCYSRATCKELEINYNDIREEDVTRIRQYLLDTYFTIKKDKEQ